MNAPALPLPVSFALAVRGYDRAQVDEHLADLHDEIRLLTLDRDAALAEAGTLARLLESARAETGDVRARLDRVVRTPADPASVGDRVQRLLELAHAEADTIVAAAHERAGAILRHATTAERRTAARLRAIDDYLARVEHILAEEPEPAVRGGSLAAA